MASERRANEEHPVAMAPTIDGRSGDVGLPAAEAETVRVLGMSPATVSQPGDPTRIGRYVVLRRLGQGGMGVVYLGYDADLDRKVAIKVVRGSAGEAHMARERVQREAQALAHVSHPNIVHVYEVGQSDGEIFIAMEYVPGVSLAVWQRPTAGMRPSVESILRVYLQAAAGLYAAHKSGVVHRDFKPENVLLSEDGRPCVLDFGLARALNGPAPAAIPESAPVEPQNSAERLTQVGAVLGTPGYMSPEQVKGADADARSDQFSFCAALYEALYQQLPFAGESFEAYACEVLSGHLRRPPPGEVPIPIEQALRRGLSIDPTARYPSMQELIFAMERGLLPDTESPATRKASRRFWLFVSCVAVALGANGLRRGLPLRDSDLSLNVAIMAMFLASASVIILVLRKTLLRRASYRRMVLSTLVICGYMMAGRALGYAQNMTLNHYVPLEMLGVGAMLALEAPYASPRFRYLAALTWACSLIVLLWPQVRAPILSSLYPVLLLSSSYFRLTAQRAADSVNDSGAILKDHG